MNDKQFEALLKVAKEISDNLEFLSVQAESIWSELADLRADYETVNGLMTTEEALDTFFEEARDLKAKMEKDSEEDCDLGGLA